jgi:hypothetical protein
LRELGAEAYAEALADVRPLRTALGEETFQRAWSDGRTISADEAFGLALQMLEG